MPSGPLDFRAASGCFLPVFQSFMLKRARKRMAMRVAMIRLRCKVDGAVLGLLLSYLFWGSLLLRCGDIESNPGPNPSQGRDTMRQTRLSSAGTAGPRPGFSNSNVSSQPGKEPTIADVLEMLHAMKTSTDTRLDGVKQEIHELRERFTIVEDDLKGLREEVSSLRKENADLTAKVEELERKTDDLESRSKRNNVIFYGLPRPERETPAECEDLVREVITDKLELSQTVEFDRVHRLNNKPDSPVIARCVFYKQKLDILKATRKLQGTSIFVGEDFAARVRDIRRRLTPHMKKARSEGKRANLSFDHLFIDNKRYTVDRDDRLVEQK